MYLGEDDPRLAALDFVSRELGLGVKSTRDPHIYVAHPIRTHGTTFDGCQRAAIEARFPTAVLIDSATAFSDHADWCHRWPSVLGSVDRLVAFGDEHGEIGRGTFREIAHALGRDVPVCFLDASGRFSNDAAIDMVPHRDRSYRRFARLLIG
jgi:hypothetical protein